LDPPLRHCFPLAYPYLLLPLLNVCFSPDTPGQVLVVGRRFGRAYCLHLFFTRSSACESCGSRPTIQRYVLHHQGSLVVGRRFRRAYCLHIFFTRYTRSSACESCGSRPTIQRYVLHLSSGESRSRPTFQTCVLPTSVLHQIKCLWVLWK
jgi:hypothetical protein